MKRKLIIGLIFLFAFASCVNKNDCKYMVKIPTGETGRYAIHYNYILTNRLDTINLCYENHKGYEIYSKVIVDTLNK